MATPWEALYVPLDSSGRSRGEERAPEALAAAGLARQASVVGERWVDAFLRDYVRDSATGIIGFRQLVDVSRLIQREVAAVLESRHRPLVVGGCCSLVPGTLGGVRSAVGPFSLLFVDGHVDFYDGRSSSTGEAADMDLAIATGHGPEELTGLSGKKRIADPEHVVVVGHRDEVECRRLGAVDPAQAEPRLTLIDSVAALAQDPGALARATRSQLERAGRPIWLHLDLDVLDAEAMPAVTYPQPNGFGWDYTCELIEPIATAPLFVGCDVTDLNADLDEGGRLAGKTVELVATLTEVSLQAAHERGAN
jgi:arginase